MRGVPSKLPQVDGDGPVAEGFRLSFAKINEIIDYLESIRAAPSAESYTGHAVVGVTRRPRVKLEDVAAASTDVEARWA